MESSIKEMRVRFSGTRLENKDETGSIKDKQILLQKTQSFKGEKKKGQNWFRRQFSRQMSWDYDTSNGGEYPTAIAAAAFAIKSLEESSIPDQRKTSQGPDRSITKTRSKSEDLTRPSRSRLFSRRFSDDGSMKNLDVPDERVPISAATDQKMPEKAIGKVPSIKRTPTFVPAASIKKAPTLADKELNITAGEKPQSQVPKPKLPSTKQHILQPIRSAILGTADTQAEDWENTEMAKIKQNYEKLMTEILNWESARKQKAKRRLDEKEAELDKRRAKAVQNYRSKMESIDQIAAGAKAQAEDNRRKQEFKVKEKANKIRSTGKLPVTCCCF